MLNKINLKAKIKNQLIKVKEIKKPKCHFKK
jgi:hypothetical protein